MIELPNVTLVAIDVISPRRTLDAMHRVQRHCRFRDAVLLTNLVCHSHLDSKAVRLKHHEESNAIFEIPGDNGRVCHPDYELSNLIEPVNEFQDGTTHILYMESDSGIINPDAWSEEFLGFDFVGAPWPVHQFDGWPSCDGISNAVGNFGFSLRSRRFCELVAQKAVASEDKARFSCDAWACRTIRPELERSGIRYAPVAVASRFSCEDRIYSGQFGFHGRMTMQMNNWK